MYPRMEKTITPTELSKIASISIPYASQILSGKRPWTRRAAIDLYLQTGHKIGPIAKATDEEIQILDRFERS